MQRAALARRVAPDTSRNDIAAQKRREALTKQLSRKSLPIDDLADLFRVDDQIAYHGSRLDEAFRRIDFVRDDGAQFSEKIRHGAAEHRDLAAKVENIEARTQRSFRRADEVMNGHTVDIARLFETRNAHSRQIDDLTKEQRLLELAVGEKIILSQLDRDKLARHEAEMAEFRYRLEAIEAKQPRQIQDKPLPAKNDGLPLSAQIVLWTGALAAVGAAIYSFIA